MIVGECVYGPEERETNIRRSLEVIRGRRIPPLAFSGARRAVPVHVVCYGPSLRDTWEEISGPVISVSGAHDWLLDRWIRPTWHVECDPRPYKARIFRPFHLVSYIVATVCDPTIWDRLRGARNVSYFHAMADDRQSAMVGNLDPGALEISGSTVGLKALAIAWILGFRRAIVHGMDCSYRGDARHAGPHPAPRDDRLDYHVDGERFETSPQMLAAAEEFLRIRDRLPLRIDLRGRGMLQAMTQARDPDPVKPARSRTARAVRKAFDAARKGGT